MGSSSPPPPSSTTSLPLNPTSILAAHTLIKPYIHRTPLVTSRTLNTIASTPNASLGETPTTTPKLNLYFKCENAQKIGAFKARGAHHALLRLIERQGLDAVRRRGVVTHSSGNHAQALALAASTFGVPSYIVMPTISTPSKIAGTRSYTDNVIFSGSTSVEREKVVAEVVARTDAILVPPYDDPDIILGQGTAGLEMEEQLWELREAAEEARRRKAEEERVKPKESKSKSEWDLGMDGWFERMSQGVPKVVPPTPSDGDKPTKETRRGFDAVVAPIGGGGLLAGLATHFSSTTPATLVFGAEPRHQGANDAERGLRAGARVEHVRSLTIADGLRTPVGLLNWSVVSDRSRVRGVHSVSEEEIKAAMRLVFERMKVVVEPSGAVALAVVLFCGEWRRLVAERQRGEGAWDVGVVFSGGNTTMEALVALFGEGEREREREREEGMVGMDGGKGVEDVAG